MRTLNKIIIYIFLIVTALITIYPLLYVFSAAFSKGQSISALNIIPFGDGINFNHFRYLFKETNYLNWFKNTFIVAALTSALTVLIASLSAYVFSRFNFTIKKTMLMTLLILQIFPSMLAMIAIYVLLLRMRALDTLWGLVLVYVAGNIPYNTWLVKSYMDTIPRSLDESARIDGASHLTIFFRVILPVATPIIIFLAIVTFTAPWMDFIFPKMILRSPEKQTLALGLFGFVTDKKSEFGSFAAGSILVAIPFIIFFILGHKHMISSFGAGAVKE
ncbi:MAG: sugar ABC transporter permease [Halanaerobiaceae bacterium]|jgi:arabinogalactan oligomer/maltooligosaccharide transport system permease protein|nr:sugar ABC transporter permease [Bacillota bacterium]NLJ84666.1 sugar ABC transporter permease [Halanaerobiaceae bacterium]HHU92139.1 sugar ABC transporter permease [Halanaerobiaceae bacterium]